MNIEYLERNKLEQKLNKHLEECKVNQLTYAAIQKVNKSLENFYQAKKEIEETIKDFVNLDAINKIKEEYKEIQELLNYFKSTDVSQRLHDLELEIAILKEGGNI